jgi:hypothetical protein
MTEPKLISPPPELMRQWWEQADQYQDDPKTYFDFIVTEVAQWGADQELDACCEWVSGGKRENLGEVLALRAARRPKPPSLKEQALEGLTRLESTGEFFSNQMKDLGTIRRAIEALPE